MSHRARTLVALCVSTAVLGTGAATPAVAKNRAACKSARAELQQAKRNGDRQAVRVAQRKVARYC